jgi:hypothetical protein
VRRISINTPLVLSLAFLALAAITLLVQLPPLVVALVTPRPGADPTHARLDEYLASHEDDLATYRDRFDGRSLFFMPSAPRDEEPPPPQPQPDDEPKEAPPPPPPPRSYEGPSVLFVLGDEVWFHDGVRARVGEEGSNGVTVISSDPPWEVKLRFRGGEFKIELFDRSYPGLDDRPPAQPPVPGLVRVESKDDSPEKPEGEGARTETP